MNVRCSRLARVILIALALGAVPAYAGNLRLERVLLLPSVDRSSIVFELNGEPPQVSTRRISESVFELEAGPGIESVAPQLLKAPTNVRFVDSVTVRVTPTASGPVVRARIVLSASAQAVVRSAGRRVYVDVSPMPAPSVAHAGPPTRAASAGVASATPVRASSTPPARQGPDDAYKAAVRPSIEKLRELSPFLASAATSADGTVSTAVLPTLTSLRANLAALQPPDAARGSHTMVLGAVDRIVRALAPDFTGDRGAAVRQSITTIEVVGGVLVGE